MHRLFRNVADNKSLICDGAIDKLIFPRLIKESDKPSLIANESNTTLLSEKPFTELVRAGHGAVLNEAVFLSRR